MVGKIGIALGVAGFASIGGYSWNRDRMWTLRDRNGRAVCRVQVGWNEQEVAARCGIRSGRGVQPTVAAQDPESLSIRMCSAPGDVYGTKAVLYGCDGRVQAVEPMPARGFIYPSE